MSYQPASGQLVGRSLLSGAHHPTSLFPASVAAGALSWPPLPPTGSLFGLTLLGPGPSLFGPPCFTPVPAPPLPPPPHLPLMSALCHPTATVSDRFVAAASRLAAPPANGADITNDCATTAAVCHNVDDRRLSLYYRTSREQEWQWYTLYIICCRWPVSRKFKTTLLSYATHFQAFSQHCFWDSCKVCQ